MKTILTTLLFLSMPLSSVSFAQSSSDVLLNQLGETPPEPDKAVDDKPSAKTAVEHVAQSAPVKMRVKPPQDVFQKQLEIKAYRQEDLPFDVNQWVQDVIYADFSKAAHLWTAIQGQITDKFRFEADATQLYLLWKLGLNQTFFDEWIRALAIPGYSKSPPELALEDLVTPGLDGWLLRSPVVLSPSQVTVLERHSAEKPFLLTLMAWDALQHHTKLADILKHLPASNKLAPLLAEREVYSRAQAHDLKGAAWALKNYLEPAVLAAHDPELTVHQDQTIARILYQAGQMPAAQVFYEKIPNQSAAYLSAREELAWVYLRLADMSKLRGQIKALTLPIFRDRFQPEVFLLRAVSDLKMCFYDELDRDLNDFSRSNASWAKKIDGALASSAVPAPDTMDIYSTLSVRGRSSLDAELKRLTALGEQSIGAALPAVGWQRHWKDYITQVRTAAEESRKFQNDQFARQWKNERNALSEAIRKMRFVKVEYMSQVRQLSSAPGLDTKTMVASASATASEVVGSDTRQLTFPIENDVWSDELFKMRSAAQAQCVKKAKHEKGDL
jgi:hypothetical protein